MRLFMPALSLLFAFGAVAQPAPARAEGQPDVIYVPTPQHVVEVMLRLTEITNRDLLYDLGSGDGRIVITAAKLYGARGVGIDIDPERIAESKANAKREGVAGKVKFVHGDLFKTDLRPATAVTLYLLNSLNLRLRPKLLTELRPGTPVVSHDFDMGEWEPDETVKVGNSTVFFWRVPAEVDGEWEMTLKERQGERRLRLHIDQAFQKISGIVEAEGAVVQPVSGRLNGEHIELSLAPADGGDETRVLTGRINKDAMNGTVSANGNPGTAAGSWKARRIAALVRAN